MLTCKGLRGCLRAGTKQSTAIEVFLRGRVDRIQDSGVATVWLPRGARVGDCMSARIRRFEMNELDPAVAEALRARVERLGYLGEFFRCAGNQPAPLLDFIRFTEHAKEGLSNRLVELIALTVSCRLGNLYERHQHERLCVKQGFGAEWVTSVEMLDPSRLSDETERAVQQFVLSALDRWGHETGDELETVIDRIGPESAVAMLFVLGRYLVHAMFVNALALSPPVPSIFADVS